MTELQSALLEQLAAHTTMTLATSGSEGPWAAAVFYVHDTDFNLYFLSDPATRHGREMGSNSRVAAAIHQDGQDWRRIVGMQLVGTAGPVSDARELLKAWGLYLGRFPFVQDFLHSPGVFRERYAASMGKVRLFRLSPERIWLTDNRREFGKRQVYEMMGRSEVGAG